VTTSAIAWIDFADADRRKMIAAVSAFRDRDTRDELGFGSVRDALSDLLLPGTSTLQTRARYFLFVPWIYQHLEQRRVPSRRIGDRLRHDEIHLMSLLRESGERGVIGERSGASLQRFPSSIYWRGFSAWGIMRFAGSQQQYHRWLDTYYQRTRQGTRPEDGASLSELPQPIWDPNLPAASAGFLDEATFQLSPEEAAYLRERLLLTCPDAVLATMVDLCDPVNAVDYVWQHPQLARLTAEQLVLVDHARRFSEATYGAVLLYNLMLAELRDEPERSERYRADLVTWRESSLTAGLLSRPWDRGEFWQFVLDAGRIPAMTRRFVNRWLDLLPELLGPSEAADNHEARRLVRQRERWLKRGRSRFDSRRHLELWSGAAGLGQINYRWGVVRTLINDIVIGLGRE